MMSNESTNKAFDDLFAVNKKLRAENLRLSQALAGMAEELEEIRARYDNLIGGIKKMIEAEKQNGARKK